MPFAGAMVTWLTRRIKTVYDLPAWIGLAAVIITLILAFILRASQVEMILGDWSPVSFTGTPLIIAANPEGIAILIAVAGVMGLSIMSSDKAANPAAGPIAGLSFAALSVTVLAHDLVTLLIGLGLLDMLTAVYALLQTHHPRRIMRDVLFNVASLLALAIAVTLCAATGNSLYMPLAHLPDRVMPFIAIALLFRFSLLPLRSVTDRYIGHDWAGKSSILAGMLVLARLPQLEAPQLHAWFFAFALLTAICALAIGVLSKNRATLMGSIETGTLALALTSAVPWQAGAIITAAVAWLLGTALIDEAAGQYPARYRPAIPVVRAVAALSLAGLPLTAGFVGRAGVISTWAARDIGGAALIMGFSIAQIVLVAALLRLMLWHEPAGGEEEHTGSATLRLAVLGIPSILVVLFGLAPGLSGAGGLSTTFDQVGLAGWIFWIIPSALGGLLWYMEKRWSATLNRYNDRLMTALELNWWQDILAGAIGRLSKPFTGVLTLLESDGALLWAVIVILIAVLISRPGGP